MIVRHPRPLQNPNILHNVHHALGRLTTSETARFTTMALEPKPLGEMPNHHADFGGTSSTNQPNL